MTAKTCEWRRDGHGSWDTACGYDIVYCPYCGLRLELSASRSRDTVRWLRDLGAVRPMAPVGDHVLVLGAWKHGHYPVRWQLHFGTKVWVVNERIKLPPLEEWQVYGRKCGPLDRETVERIIAAASATA